ncbi:ABC transporter substrate-binding protein [Paucibacter sp. APW11]|uniref:ABC transporter substrate-binding protein n=1 Tax=Roseateles aquae TaxID=3077235 RepID=A0ABU3PHK8_9BURK|nr:ABC transporter substrate-binding protein [Paucibacter sp. APW11]MDT9001910.1 ABC transporter substrate-binding protein [Paucibacter sp. APW11]
MKATMSKMLSRAARGLPMWGRGALGALLLGLQVVTPVQAAPGEVIGAIVPESRPNAAQGEEIRNGMMLALKTWPGQPVPTLVIKDSACDSDRAKAAANALVAARVDIVLGGWCELGEMPAVLRAAGIPFVSSNAERLKSGEGTLQLGRVGFNVAENIATKLRSETSLRVTASSACWIDFEAPLSPKYDAALCPVPTIDKARWAEIAPTYLAAFRKPFTLSAARGYAAMEVALAYIKRTRAGAKSSAAVADTQGLKTLMGPVMPRDSNSDDVLRLSFAPKLPRLPAREAGVLEQLVKSKSCDCKPGDCGKGGPWGGMPFTVQSGAASCGQLLAGKSELAAR